MKNPEALARAHLQSHFGVGGGGSFESLDARLLAQPAACFVTLKTPSGHLRGCIGTFEPQTESLADEICVNAISAASKDPRFPPVLAAELADLRVSVDVLSPLEKISEEELDPTIYGVVVRDALRAGVLLPNLDGVDTVAKQVGIACQKAGIDPDGRYEVWRFTVRRYEEA